MTGLIDSDSGLSLGSGLNWLQGGLGGAGLDNIVAPAGEMITESGVAMITESGVIMVTEGEWTPLALGSSLVAWYDATDLATIHLTGNGVSQWDDKSGNGYHLLQATASARPSYSIAAFQSSASGVIFDGVDDRMTATGVPMGVSAFSMFAFAQMQAGGTVPAYLTSFQANGDTNPVSTTASVMALGTNNGNVDDLIGRRNGSVVASMRHVNDGQTPLNGVYYRLGSVWDGANQTLYIDNVLASTPAASTPALGAVGTIEIGARDDGFGAWKAPVKNIIIMNRAATSTERADIDNYCTQSWPRVVVVEGDSIGWAPPPEAGDGTGTNGYAYQYIPNAAPIMLLSNIAIPGSRLNTNGPNNVGDTYPGDLTFRVNTWTNLRLPLNKAAKQYVFFNGIGANDTGYMNDAAAYALAISAYCASQKAAGWDKIVIQTILSRTDSLQDDPWRNAYNAIITAPGWAAANGIDGVVNFAADPIMGVNSAPDVYPAYFLDQVHPNTAGHTRLEPYFRSIINALPLS